MPSSYGFSNKQNKFYNKFIWKCPSSIRCWDSNSWPLEYQSLCVPMNLNVGPIPIRRYPVQANDVTSPKVLDNWPVVWWGDSCSGDSKFESPKWSVVRKGQHRSLLIIRYVHNCIIELAKSIQFTYVYLLSVLGGVITSCRGT